MKHSLAAALLFLIQLTAPIHASAADNKASIDLRGEQEISRSPGDKGRYFALEKTRKKGMIVRVTHKRAAPDGSVGYTITETDCDSWRMRTLGYSEKSVDDIRPKPDKWYEIIDGSSKSHVANFACAGVYRKLKPLKD